MGQSTRVWIEELADFALKCFNAEIPDDVLARAALQLYDTIACAAGAHDAPPVEATWRVVQGSAPNEATVWFRGTRTSVVDAILVNGTAVRFLDANDIPFSATKGPGGHPSDNIVVAASVAERVGATGKQTLAGIVLAYELMWRLRNHLEVTLNRDPAWDHVSWSGTVAAAVAAALMGADRDQTAHAMAIGASKGYAVKAIRWGRISMLKAAANAAVAREGVLAAMMAMEGMTGPIRVFESDSGVIRSLGGEPEDGILDLLVAPPAWAIRKISIKAFPAIGTSQAAIHAATSLHAEHDFSPGEIERISVRFPPVQWLEETRAMPERLHPETRESADHSIPFLVVLGLLYGDVTHAHFDEQRWEDPEIQALMRITELEGDDDLLGRSETTFPAIVEVTMSDGRAIRKEMIDTPGSPNKPWARSDIEGKFVRLDRVGLSQDRIRRIGDACVNLVNEPDLEGLLSVLGPSVRPAR